jgi:hypothetical protein
MLSRLRFRRQPPALPNCIRRYIQAELDEDEVQNIFKAESAAHEVDWMRVASAR